MTTRRRVRITLMCLISPLLLAGGDGARADIDWRPVPPEEAGMESGELARLLGRAQELRIDLHSLIMVRNGRVVLECYAHPYDATTLHNIKSVSKCVVSAIVGIALREGTVRSLDETVFDHFPQYFPEEGDPRKRAITLRHLLTMSSGLELDENGPIMGQIFAGPDWIAATLKQPVVSEPGTVYNYSTPLTHIMSGVLTEASGQSLLALGERFLFDPLEIAGVQWRTGPMGYSFGGSEVFMTPRDMVRFGFLFLNDGVWEGKQVLPQSWVEVSTTGHIDIPRSNKRYGYGWYADADGSVSAVGWGGQWIRYDRSMGLLIVVTAASHDAGEILFRDFDFSTIHDKAQRPDPVGFAELARLVGSLAEPAPVKVTPHPAAAAQIDGKRYWLDPNPRFRSIGFAFPSEGEAAMRVETSAESYNLAIGLDGRYRLSDVGESGAMPQGNQVAVRGMWQEDGTFSMEFHEIGSPTHSQVIVSFEGDRIEMAITDRPLFREFTLGGRIR